MLRTIVDARALIAMVIAAGVGTWGVYAFPVNPDNVFLALIALQNPPVFHVFTYGYATLWFSTPFFAGVDRALRRWRSWCISVRTPTRTRPLPPYPAPELRGRRHRLCSARPTGHDARPRARRRPG